MILTFGDGSDRHRQVWMAATGDTQAHGAKGEDKEQAEDFVEEALLVFFLLLSFL